ncbi:hypothetical protein I4U23_001499 [Adineta vaga]|nr:hypothetical protein I4U23_001499 [Adineta vaga]
MQIDLNVLPTEIFFEIFDYLTVYDIFYAWINLNLRINDIVRLYPIKLDFQRISRSKFDFICQFIQPTQVISLCLSEEMMPNQVELFRKMFPNFSQQFLSLKQIQYINTSTILSHLPICLSSLSIKTYLKTSNTNQLINQILHQQAQYLTYLQVDGSYVFRSLHTSFPSLTHLIIDYCTITEYHQIIDLLQSSLIYLKLYLVKDDNEKILNFQSITKSLRYLSLSFSEEILMSFDLLIQSIDQLSKLIHLTLQATGTFDLMDGTLWELYLNRRKLEKFHFKFLLANSLTCEQDKHSLLETFRSNFWLEEKHWYVACEKGNLKSSRPILYSIPYFRPSLTFYPSNHFLLISTLDKNDIIFNQTTNLILTYHKFVQLPYQPFTHVYTLTLFTSTLPSIEILQSIVNIQQIQHFDISLIKYIVHDELLSLIHSMKNLKCIKMQYDPLFIPPYHIESYIFVQKDRENFVLNTNNINRFCHLFFHIKFLEITVESKELIIQLLNQLHYLEFIKIYCYQDSLSHIKSYWLKQNIPRLKMIHFTHRITSSCILLSIGGTKIMDDISIDESFDDTPIKSGCYKFRSRCAIQ